MNGEKEVFAVESVSEKDGQILQKLLHNPVQMTQDI